MDSPRILRPVGFHSKYRTEHTLWCILDSFESSRGSLSVGYVLGQPVEYWSPTTRTDNLEDRCVSRL